MHSRVFEKCDLLMQIGMCVNESMYVCVCVCVRLRSVLHPAQLTEWKEIHRFRCSVISKVAPQSARGGDVKQSQFCLNKIALNLNPLQEINIGFSCIHVRVRIIGLSESSCPPLM